MVTSRTVYTNSDGIYPVTYLPETPYALKPNGLWYGLNGEWEHWCRNEWPERLAANFFEITVDCSNILIIDSYIKVAKMHRSYSHPLEDYGFRLNWPLLKKDYSGFEIRRFYELKAHVLRSHLMPVWFYSLDCSCGCVWDLSVVNIKTKNELETL